MTVPMICIIQAAYTDERLSRRRLEIAEHTSAVALRTQSVKPVVHIAVNPADPCLAERQALYWSTGCEIRWLMRPAWNLYRENWELPEGRKIVTRLDDDDVWPHDFCERTIAAAPAAGEHALIWPRGYVWWRQTAYLLRHPGIQFVTLVTDQQTDPHQEQHWQYHRRWHSITVSNDPGWLWIRHGDAATVTLPRYRQHPLQGIDSQRFRVNLRAIVRALEPSGIPAANYHERHATETLRHVLQENAKHAPSRS